MARHFKVSSLFPPFASVLLLLGCNSILGIQKANLVEEPSNECDLELDDKLVDGCIFRASCDPISPPFNLSNCVTYRSQAVFAEEKGTLNATSCAPVEQNVGRRYEPPSNCPSAEKGWSCSEDGKLALYCGDGRPFVRDCSVRGSVCTVEQDASSGAYPCGLPDHISCQNGEDRTTFCEGSFQLGCTDGRAVGYDCDVVDTKCFETDSGATCLPDTGNCTNVGKVTCASSSKIDYCADPGVTIHYQCSAGTKCEDGDLGVDCYVDGCTPEPGCKEGCADDENTLEFCVAGAKVTRKCSDYGFDYCSSYDSSDGKTTFAYCMMDPGKPFPGTTADWSAEPAPAGTGGRGSNPEPEGSGGRGSNPEPEGTGGSGPAPGSGGQGSADDYCYPIESGTCSSVEACSSDDGSSCYFLVNGSSRIDEDCDNPGPGYNQIVTLCGLAPGPSPPGG